MICTKKGCGSAGVDIADGRRVVNVATNMQTTSNMSTMIAIRKDMNNVPSDSDGHVSDIYRRRCLDHSSRNNLGGGTLEEKEMNGFRLVHHPDRIHKYTIWRGDYVVQFARDLAEAIAWASDRRRTRWLG